MGSSFFVYSIVQYISMETIVSLIKAAETWNSVENQCLEILGEFKWINGFICENCKGQKFKVNKDFSRKCTDCKKSYSPIQTTLLIQPELD